MGSKKILIPFALIVLPMAGLFSEVANKDKPQRGEWDFKLEKVWEIGKAGEDVLGRPQGILVSDDGTLYLSDEANRKDQIYDPDGRWVGSFAPRGEGPGEVRRHGRFFFADGKVIIPDAGRIHYFSREGKHLKTVRKDCEPHAFLDENRLIHAPLSAAFLPEGKGTIALCDLRSGRDKAIAEFSAFEGGIARDAEVTVDVVVPVFSPLMTMGCSEGRLYWGLSDRYRIHVMDLEGREIASFSLDRRKTRVSPGDKREYFRKGDMPDEMLKQIVDGLPDELTCFHRIDVHNGLVYVFVTDIDLENKMLRVRQIDIFSPEGIYLYKARLDFGKDRVHLFSPLQNMVIRDGCLYAVLQDDQDNVLIAKYTVSLPAL